MNVFERYLTLWVALCIASGIVLGRLFPGVFESIGAAELAQINLPMRAPAPPERQQRRRSAGQRVGLRS
jgi:ACR3 family arsenite efflux pump ArsB